jgi:hypothetical protein
MDIVSRRQSNLHYENSYCFAFSTIRCIYSLVFHINITFAQQKYIIIIFYFNVFCLYKLANF